MSYTLALERADDADFTTGAYARTFVVLGAKPEAVYPEGPVEKWGYGVENSTVYWYEVTVVLDLVGIGSFGTMIDLEYIIGSPYFRLLADGTDLPDRKFTPTGENFWTGPTVGWARENLPVARVSYSPSSDFNAGSDSATLRLRPLDPENKPAVSV